MRASFGVYIMRTINWEYPTQQVKRIDQRRLPASLEWISCTTANYVAKAIRTMAIRGAPAIGAAGAFGVALTASQSTAKSNKKLEDKIKLIVKMIRNSHPTAINLKRALDRMLKVSHQKSLSAREKVNSLVQEAKCIADEGIQTNKRIVEFGSGLIQDGDVIIHHCNTGSLATAEGGIALGVFEKSWKQGKKINVLVDETRPRLQGARLTSWELQNAGIPYEIITDNATGNFLQKHIATKVMFDADWVAFKGNVANKVGTYMLSLAARATKFP
jgi:methylthioribose-1-phosphate isomerase